MFIVFFISWVFFLFILEFKLSIDNNNEVKSLHLNKSRWIKNITFGIVNRIIEPFTLIIVSLLAVKYSIFNQYALIESNKLLLIILIPLNLLILDFVSYWYHVLCHKIDFFWNLHELHHLDNRIDCTTGFRIHILELLGATLLRGLVIICLGIPLEIVILFEMILQVEGMFHHSNIKINPKFDKILRKIIITPNFHRVHHYNQHKYYNSNYGFIFPYWDYIFNTYNDNFKKNEFGLKYAEDKKYGAIKQLLLPLYGRSILERKRKRKKPLLKSFFSKV
jgi:sterol desaturase/sphingolipid hydroxylase (fatty acid hydroxylase superfamily)